MADGSSQCQIPVVRPAARELAVRGFSGGRLAAVNLNRHNSGHDDSPQVLRPVVDRSVRLSASDNKGLERLARYPHHAEAVQRGLEAIPETIRLRAPY